jgi:hypothetical protein
MTCLKGWVVANGGINALEKQQTTMEACLAAVLGCREVPSVHQAISKMLDLELILLSP